MYAKDAARMVNRVDPDKTDVSLYCFPDLSVLKLRILTVGYELCHEKTCLCHMQTKAKISLHIRTV